MNCNESTPFEFFEYTIHEIQSISNGCWPWSNVSVSEWIDATHFVRRIPQLREVRHYLTLIISFIGTFGSLLTIVVLWRKAIIGKESFYLWMFIIGVLDLLFNLLYLIVAFCITEFSHQVQFSYAAMKMATVLVSLFSSLSLASDVCALILTVERYLVICHPTLVVLWATMGGTRRV